MENIHKVSQTARPSTFWDQDLLNKTRKKYLTEVKTVDQFYHFLQDNLHPMVSHASSSYPLNYQNINHPINLENFTFQKIGKIESFDVDKTLEKVLIDNPNIDANNSKNCKFRRKLQRRNRIFSKNGI